MQLVLIFFFVAVLLILLLLTQASHRAADLQKEAEFFSKVGSIGGNSFVEKLGLTMASLYAGIVFCFVFLIILLYIYFGDSIYAGHLDEWMNLVIRWMHITFGIAWIGTSFFFVFMENSLHKNSKKPQLKGDLWMLHGGGFWFVQKYKVAPKVMPEGAHWFKYEAYFTWLTGFALMFIVYYFNAEAMLLNPEANNISGWMGITIGISSLLVGYVIYHLMSLTPLLKRPLLFGIIGFILLIGFAYFYTTVFNPRAAYIHFGALIGTLMAGNVFFVIIPGQKAMVKATRDGTYLDPAIGQFAGLRSYHNNYFTLPVLFVMISNHFPTTFGYDEPWLILVLLSLASGGVKHYLNLKEKHQQSVWVMPTSILVLVATVFITAPTLPGTECRSQVSFTEVYSIFQNRCVTCHSSQPTDDVWTSPPNGIVYDTPGDIAKLTDKIMQRVVITRTMPQNNKTGITPEERDVLRCWIEQGAQIDQ